jgi:transcription initiation factor TFIIIB Brf1 subunit/transcription initiation factor TFIIB
MATASVMNGGASYSDVSTSPVLYALPTTSDAGATQRCRSCHSTALNTDWAQGDRVCTACGVVSEGHLVDDRPEWRDFNDDNDLAKGGRSGARSGLVAVDDTRYIGGLQPTTLSKQVFGGARRGSSLARKRLLAANYKIDRKMEQMHKRSLNTAKLSQQARKRRLQDDETDVDVDNVRPEYEELLIQEEENTNRMQAALQADKWSLQRAIRLCAPEELSSLDKDNEELEDLKKRLDAPLKRSSQELYCAYSMLLAAAQTLQLPDRVSNEATTTMCQYASRRDGLTVRGVASTLTRKSKATGSAQEEADAKEALRDYNKMKQLGSLCAALLFFTARNLGWPRSLVEICESIQPGILSSSRNLDIGKDQFIKRKHCSRAMTEIKELFPSMAVANITNTEHIGNHGNAVTNFTEHAIRKLKLPPVAEACVRLLVVHYRKDQEAAQAIHGKRLPSICAAMAFFVCAAGGIMQQLAAQSKNNTKRRSVAMSATSAPPPAKKIKLEPDRIKKEGVDETVGMDVSLLESGDDTAAEQQAYEIRRMWDAWAEQTTWARTLSEIEQSCGVSRNSIVDFYRANLYPQRHTLLLLLKSAVSSCPGTTSVTIDAESTVLAETPLASVLLPHIFTASTLLKTTY